MPYDKSGTISLAFKSQDHLDHVGDPIAKDLSAVAVIEGTMFVTCDETAGLDRLRAGKNGKWGDHEHINLGDFFDLPDGPDGEMDIEGLCHDDGWLWVCGSHSLKREDPERGDNGPTKALNELAKFDRDPNRAFLGRIPLAPDDDGGVRPVKKHQGRRAQSIRLRRKRAMMKDWMKGDPHLAPFLDIPSKENGFDIEGIVARGNRVWLGLRGPVLRGHAIIVEMNFKEKTKRILKPRRIDGKRRYRKYALRSDGLGIRDLALDGADMLLLLGPVGSADGPAPLLRWKNATQQTRSAVIAEDRIERVGELPYAGHRDHPEGLETWPGKKGEFLVVYDNPRDDRISDDGLTILGDIISAQTRALPDRSATFRTG